jgi:myosin heavy subunit
MEILNSKEILLTEINKILNEFTGLKENHGNEIKKLHEEMKKLNMFNNKLTQEIRDKDKLLHIEEKRQKDYEEIINKIQEEANKEISEKERFTIMKAQDKEIHERDNEIKRLQKRINLYEEKKESVEMKIVDNPKNNEVIEIIDKETGEENPQFIYDVEEKVEKKVEEKVEKKVETEVIENEINEIDAGSDNLSDEEDAVEVDILKYRNKEYYIITGENPQYIYAIDDGEMGDKVGVIEGRKKVFYKSSKK